MRSLIDFDLEDVQRAAQLSRLLIPSVDREIGRLTDSPQAHTSAVMRDWGRHWWSRMVYGRSRRATTWEVTLSEEAPKLRVGRPFSR